MAEQLRKEPGLQVKEEDGQKGEFTVLVDGREVLHKEGHDLPPVEKVLAAVHGARQEAAGARH